MPDRAPGKTWVALAGLALVAIATRGLFLAGPQIDYDEGVYWQSLRALASGHALFSSVYSSQPPGFLLLLAPFYDILGQSLPAARAGVAFISLLGIGAAYILMTRLAGPGPGLAAAALLIADPLYLRQSVTLQADGPALALALCSLALATVRPDGEAGNDAGAAGPAAFGAGALLGLAVTVKFLAVPAALPLLLLLRPSRSRILLAAAGGVLAIGIVLAPYAGELELLGRQSIGLHVGGPAGALTSPADLWDLARWEVPLFLAAIVSLYLWRSLRSVLVPATWLALGGVALLFIHPLWPHHLIAVSVPLALLAAPSISRLATGRPKVGTVAVVAGLAAALVIVMAQQIPAVPGAAERLGRLTAPGTEVITDDQFGAALANRSTPPELVDTSAVRIRSGDLTVAEIARIAQRDRVAVVVLATGRFTSLPGFVEWASAAYPTRTTETGQEIFRAR